MSGGVGFGIHNPKNPNNIKTKNMIIPAFRSVFRFLMMA